MANQVALSNKTLIDIKTNSPIATTGTVSRSGSVLKLGPNSSATYKFEYETSGVSMLQSDGLQLDMIVRDMSGGVQTRYNSNLRVVLIIQFYKEDTDENGNLINYVSGGIAQYTILPYVTSETEGYIDFYQIPLTGQLVQSIEIKFINDINNAAIEFSEVSLRYTMTMNKAIQEVIGFDISLQWVDWYPNGFKLNYQGTENDDRFYWNGDTADELNGIDINHVRLLPIVNHTEFLD